MALKDPLLELQVHADRHTAVAEGSWIRYGTTLRQTTIASGVFVGFACTLHHVTCGPAVMVASRSALLGEPGAGIEVGTGAWIAAGCRVDPGVRVGTGAVLGAGAHLTQDLDDWHVAVGRPARVVRRRTPTRDGWPDISTTLALVRARDSAWPPFRDRTPAEMAARLAERFPTRAASWRVDPSAVLDAEIDGGDRIRIGAGAILMGRPRSAGGLVPEGGIRLGAGVDLGADVILEGSAGLDLEAGVQVGDRAVLVSSGHDVEFTSLPWRAGRIRIGHGARIGEDSIVAGPATIGAHAVVLPGSVVIGDVPPHAVTAGVGRPAAERDVVVAGGAS